MESLKKFPRLRSIEQVTEMRLSDSADHGLGHTTGTHEKIRAHRGRQDDRRTPLE
jgi:hypothetical protein